MRGGAGITFNRGLTHRFEKVKRSLALADLQHVFNGTYNGSVWMKERNSSGKLYFHVPTLPLVRTSHGCQSWRIIENMKAFAVVEDKLPLSWNKGDQAVLPPTEFTRSSHKAAEWVKRWDLFIYIFFNHFHGEILLLWASRITLKINLVDKLEDCSNYSNFFDSLLKFFIILPVRFLRASQWTFAFRTLRLIWAR